MLNQNVLFLLQFFEGYVIISDRLTGLFLLCFGEGLENSYTCFSIETQPEGRYRIIMLFLKIKTQQLNTYIHRYLN